MSRIIAVVSDLHLGNDEKLDNFAGDKHFVKFCSDLVQFKTARNASLAFVLAGDVFDLWEIAPPEETRKETPANVVSEHLYFMKGAPEEDALIRSRKQLEWALERHPVFAEGIAYLVSSGVDVHYLAGNHDHQMICPDLQEHLTRLISSRTGVNVDPGLAYNSWFHDPATKTYVEHGHYFADVDSASRPGQSWMEAAPGYFFLRYVWCRLENLPKEHIPIHDVIKLVLYAISNPDFMHAAERYMREYFEAHDRQQFPLANGPDLPFIGSALPFLYKRWKADPTSNAAADPEFREAIANSKEEPVTKIVKGSEGVGVAEDGNLPGKRIDFINKKALDRYALGVRKRFGPGSGTFPPLEEQDGVTVVLGHTHEPHHSQLFSKQNPGVPGMTVRYINSGSWAERNRLGWVMVNDMDSDYDRRRLAVLKSTEK